MNKQKLKVGVASLAVTAILASTSITGANAASAPSNQNIEWNKKIVQHVMEQLKVIQNKHGVFNSNVLDSKEIKYALDTAIKVIEKKVTVVATPEVTKPEVTKPEVTKPEVTKPEVTTPEVTKPEVTTPEVTKPEVTTPEVTKPEVTTPEATKPEVTTPEVTKPEENTDKTDNSSFTAEQQQVLTIVNKERAANGLKALVLDPAISKVATEKARDMDVNNYFSHQSPTYGSPFDMLTTFGISYSYAGENIASGQRNAEEVMNAWMNSAGHRSNILNASFTKIGVGFVNGKWVQIFVG